LRAGAVDVIGKPQIGTRAFFEESRIRISDKIRAAASARLDRAGARAPQSAGVNRPETARASRQELRAHRATGAPATVRTATPARETRRAGPSPRLIAIGASTGGTEALCRIMERIPATAPPVAIVQHMPEGFTEAFARRLDSLSPMQVFEARDGVRLGPGQAVVAPGNRHLAITGGASFVACRLEDGDLVNRHRPAVDVLFHSVARLLKGDAIGVILTGMGDDGTRGLSAMREAGAHTIGQDEATSVVYGMPKAARLAGAVVQEAPLDRIASAILARVAT
jgi:two-component system chemotaxis response regulator CheB